MARQGVRVLLVDPSHPREKPCGGGVTGRALSIVSEVMGDTTLPAVRICSARFINTARGLSATVPLDTVEGDLTVASRMVLDSHLLEAAIREGATFLRARVADISPSQRMFSLRMADGTTCTVDRLVGADGANSLTRRRLSRAFRRDQISIATGFFVNGPTASEIVIEFESDPPGYLWSFPRPDHLAVGICASADAGPTAAALRTRAAAWLESAGIAPPGASLDP
jgi:flavin-dependent dehydrogenase